MRKTGIFKIGALAALFFLVGTAPGWCLVSGEDDWLNKQANSQEYWIKAGGMLLRGLDRIVESPIEIGYHTYDGAKNHLGHGEGVIKGLGTGLLWTVDGLLRGTWDVVTALFPDYHGEPGAHNLTAELHGGSSTVAATA